MSDDTDSGAFNRARVRQLMEQLSAAPLMDVIGVVGANGAGGGRSSGEELWTFLCTFCAWRIVGDEVQTRELVVRGEVEEEDYEALREAVGAGMVLHIRARVVVDSLFGRPDALVEEIVDVDESDVELHAAAVRMLAPVTFDDPVFGTLTLDRQVNWFEADTDWDGQEVALRLSAVEQADAEAALDVARALWVDRKTWLRQALETAADKLLPLKNETWLDEDEAELTAEQFQARMSLRSIVIEPDGSFEFSYDDGDLFWGHSIDVRGTLEGGFEHAGISG